MAVYLVGHITVKNEKLWGKYVAGVAESLAPFEADLVFRGRLVETLAGRHGYEQVVIIAFPDQATVHSWYGSARYQALIPLRDRAAEVVITVYEA